MRESVKDRSKTLYVVTSSNDMLISGISITRCGCSETIVWPGLLGSQEYSKKDSRQRRSQRSFK